MESYCSLCTLDTVYRLFFVTRLITNKINKVQWVDFKLENVIVSLHSLKTMGLGSITFKGILSTSCVIFSYPKLLSISVLTFIKWRLTPSYAAKDTIFWQKRPKTIVIRIIVWMTIFKSIHMAFYVNTSWACALFRNNKQHVVLGQKRNCQRVEESGLWRIPR
jgi:hypothetical protein